MELKRDTGMQCKTYHATGNKCDGCDKCMTAEELSAALAIRTAEYEAAHADRLQFANELTEAQAQLATERALHEDARAQIRTLTAESEVLAADLADAKRDSERLSTDLAVIRDLFPTPRGGDLEAYLVEAMADPMKIFKYVRKYVRAAHPATEGSDGLPGKQGPLLFARIKRYKALVGCSVKEAKEAVEANRDLNVEQTEFLPIEREAGEREAKLFAAICRAHDLLRSDYRLAARDCLNDVIQKARPGLVSQFISTEAAPTMSMFASKADYDRAVASTEPSGAGEREVPCRFDGNGCGMIGPYCRSCTSVFAPALAAPVQPVQPVQAQPVASLDEARAAGRAEAMEILMTVCAEGGVDDYLVSWPPVCADDEVGTDWDREKLRALFRTDDKLYNAEARAEMAYREYREQAMYLEHEADQRRAAPKPLAIAEAVAAMERAKKLPIWDNINHALHIELDIIFKALAAAPAPQAGDDGRDAAIAAITYALDREHCFDEHDAIRFLTYWNEGEFDKLRNNWRDVPDAVFIGVDSLHKAVTQPADGGDAK